VKHGPRACVPIVLSVLLAATIAASSSPAAAALLRPQDEATSSEELRIALDRPAAAGNKSPLSKLPHPPATPSRARPAAAHVRPALLVHIPSTMAIRSKPGGGAVIGFLAPTSRYLGTPTTAWVLDVSPKGSFGRVVVPYSGTARTGWIPLRGLKRDWTGIKVTADLSRHTITVTKLGRVLFTALAATGTPVSPTPPGRYFVSDRVPTGDPYGSFGFYAFGISGIQTHLPPGWGGGDQLAIHGTNDPGSIGRSASAGCLRVSASTLERLIPLLRLGTPVVIQR
jgi:lipoprotein-anchoring transpeptidase ErfK/SrfK